jgi:D-arabinose 1-dehydrogenase-like Zn-dependent alcohol dehydrogenase
MIKAWAVKGPNQLLARFDFDPGELGPEEVEIAVEYCGICHSDISVMNNDWGISTYPVVPGHEVIGRVVTLDAGSEGRAPRTARRYWVARAVACIAAIALTAIRIYAKATFR